MMMAKAEDVTSILLAGVGGQGIIRASDLLSLGLMAAGFDVKKSEVHGMAQRGGCVTSHVRYGAKVYSPLARKGDVHILVAFEKLETLRYLDYLRPDGMIIINDEELYPPAVNLGQASYPADIVGLVRRQLRQVKLIDAPTLALQAGNPRTANIALLGILSRHVPVPDDCWEALLREQFPEKAVAANLAAFHLGRQA